jgi:hypothetical protein
MPVGDAGFRVARPAVVPTVIAVAVMHEQVDQRAREQDQQRQNAKQVGAVLRPEKKADREKE